MELVKWIEAVEKFYSLYFCVQNEKSYREPDNKIYKDEIGMVDTKDDRNLRGNTRDNQLW